MVLFIMSILIILITNLMMMMANILSKKSFKDREKMSPFECGFDPKNSARLPFSLQFFLIAMIFLIFDVEITLLIPLIFTFNLNNFIMISLLFMLFIIILLGGLYHEWYQGALNWEK
uniref:NADH-ubiquinone oxidoreductase chain 3 n=1 Tax=Cryptolaemus montrouzieri TaxID=559131 RepID=A0A120HE46_9CUCU|nr:NADH dehydrogenase subunit 3 [Cryptolaemus montrouzieri]AMA06641.1 NADH dehydrogenase subunit 3 [Cryptolaemus montrouzieri]AMA06652.1 NADH dehydrogenase subunit 3 [Cryptolaemus montrouzieri]AMA06663.1 NADH dehydrogenase subunit 3 [Cryptolaemus montrouzieri]AMA06674.1 NADH dehydrogenase subunit 3 [Cryptolaemus montrouzieri]